MSSIEIRKVSTKADLKAFIDFHYDLYEGSPYDAPNLFSDEMNTLSKDKNAAFEFCEAEYYMAFDKATGKMVGRVAAIINHKANKKWERNDVRFGWIDFVDDINVSGVLLSAVEQYGREKGMTHVVGPLGFTDMDPEGMLTMGFDQLGTMATIYNYDYYPKHMERLGGFEKDNDYVEFKLFVPKTVPEKYAKVASLIEKRYNLHVKKLTKREIFEEGYGRRIFEIINETFAGLYGYSELTDRPRPHHADRGLERRQENRGSGHHAAVACQGTAEMPQRQTHTVRMVAHPQSPQVRTHQDSGPAARGHTARIPCQGSQLAPLCRSHPEIRGARI